MSIKEEIEKQRRAKELYQEQKTLQTKERLVSRWHPGGRNCSII